MTLAPGIHDVPASVYHDDPCDTPSLSASIAKLLVSASPAHARHAHPRLNENYERKTEDRFDLGTACHKLLLEGKNAVEVLYFSDYRTNEAKQQRDEARAAGKIPMLDSQWFEVQAMCEAVQAQLPLLEIQPGALVDGKPEQTLVWEDKGVKCRALIDWLHDDHATVDDLKTASRSANPEVWSKTMYGMGADVQAAFHSRGVQAVFGVEPAFRFIVCETEPPYAVSVVSLAPSALALANDKVEYALALWKRCLERDEWPGYDRRVHSVETPSYLEYAWLEKEAREAA